MRPRYAAVPARRKGDFRVKTGDLDRLCINTLRFLSVDAVQQARSGHPGLPLGAAPMIYTVWDRFLRFDPADPAWPDRDRFVLSAGHGSALLYSILHLAGFDLPLEELKRFRQWGSRTPGHPEYGMTPGVEATTGPLGQGIANAVGMAVAEASLAARFNRPGYPIIDHRTYVLASDGDLMEGVSYEAASFAGHLRLGKLIVLYDDNRMTIEGATDLTFSEDRRARFAASGWHVQEVSDGNDVGAICAAIERARGAADRPSFIAVRTYLGYGSPNRQDTPAAHGEPLGEEEVRLTRENLGWPPEPVFFIPEEVLHRFREARSRGAARRKEWSELLCMYRQEHPDLASEFERRIGGGLPEDWERELPVFSFGDAPVATRAASGKALNAVARAVPELVGGSADLAPSTIARITESGDLAPAEFSGRNFRFGVREHGMGSILNGMALHGGFVPYGATFLVFSDYMRPPIRLAALSRLRVIFLFTHDSIGLGEDGPTHQPVEQLLGLRSVPGLLVLRPADANETVAAWKIALAQRDRPSALVLSRQKLPVLDIERYPHLSAGVSRGGYVLADAPEGERPSAVIAATGSEVHAALSARKRLREDGVPVRVVSLPGLSLFAEQSAAYREEVFPAGAPIVAVEAGVSLGWKPYIGPGIEVIGIDRFGASAPGETVMEQYGISVEGIRQRVRQIVS